MVLRTVLKVDISCLKCKKKILKAASSLEGIDKIEVVDEAKGTVTVTGNADPYELTVRIRKAGTYAEVVSVGPPPKPGAQKKPEEKKPEGKKPDQKKPEGKKPEEMKPMIHDPDTCPQCRRIVLFPVGRFDGPDPLCCIL